jgi:hypothetical protein
MIALSSSGWRARRGGNTDLRKFLDRSVVP